MRTEMIKQFLNSFLLVCFLTVFTTDSVSAIFELDNTITCEINDSNDSEDQSKEDVEIEKENSISAFEIINPIIYSANKTSDGHLCFLSEMHSFSIPTPPPEYNI